MRADIEPYRCGIYCSERSDAQLLDFVGLVVADNAAALRRVAARHMTPGDERSVFWAIYLDQAVLGAQAAARRARWHGLKAAPDAEAARDGRSREPLLLNLPGYSGAIAYSDSDLLQHICEALYTWRVEIRDEVQADLTGGKWHEFADAMMLAELVEDRALGAEAVEVAEEKHEPTELQKACLSSRVACLAVHGHGMAAN